LADGLKLLLKETIIPSSANTGLFIVAPRITFGRMLVGWSVRPVAERLVFADVDLGVLFLFSVSALSVYGILRAGWASNSKYAFLGGLRSTAQRVSYEVSIGFTRVNVILCAGSMNLTDIVKSQSHIWYVVPLFPAFLMFLVSAVAETNRHPFDLPEAEAELVSGYNVEYSGMGFALFFLGEVGNRLLMCGTITTLFFGGWLSPSVTLEFIPQSLWFAFKVLFFVFFFVWLRIAYPRYRYDQLRRLGWKVLLPSALGRLMFTASVLVAWDGLCLFRCYFDS